MLYNDDDIFSNEKRLRELQEENAILRKRLEVIPGGDKPKELNQRHQAIIDFIKKNPGTNKEEIIKKLKKGEKRV